jgi:hypothetical protein
MPIGASVTLRSLRREPALAVDQAGLVANVTQVIGLRTGREMT